MYIDKVFLDTPVFVKYLLKEPLTAKLFSHEIRSKYILVTNTIVMQELILNTNLDKHRMEFEEINKLVDVEDANLYYESTDLRKRIKQARNFSLHSNDVLILTGADLSGCKYLLTYDNELILASQLFAIDIMTPEDFLRLAKALS